LRQPAIFDGNLPVQGEIKRMKHGLGVASFRRAGFSGREQTKRGRYFSSEAFTASSLAKTSRARNQLAGSHRNQDVSSSLARANFSIGF